MAVAPARAELTEQDLADLSRVEAYLNGISTLSARFLQLGPGDQEAQGHFFLRRPGRLRFEYAPPIPILIVADGFRLVFHDQELGQVSAWPVQATPLGPLVARTVDLTSSGRAQAVNRSAASLRVTLIDPDNPDRGSLVLVFQDRPLELKQWQGTDSQGLITVVSLSNLRIGLTLQPELFIFNDPEEPEEENR